MEEPTVADMSITDEHIVVESKTKVSDICQELSRNPEHAILVKKGKDILGVVTARDIFAKMAEGLNATKVKVDKIMRTNILAVLGNTPLSKGLDIMSTTSPDAVIVVDEGGEFLGYFSVRDYREATRKLEAHLLMAARLSRSRKAITDKKIEDDDSGGDLLDLLLGSNDEEDETEVPSMISLD
ncbi:MAG: hypothetical protein CMB76_04695 [Euryarchaeota archaeon]|nr:hypothetical protein [Euryarchaeota archaeon]|tara:strand:- start:337 stop:885 length:549 start_codon:yes stop_codon:yes gene_type:complete